MHDLSDPATCEREVRALEATGRTHRRASQVLLTLAPEAMPATVPAGIEVQSAAAWLLDPP